MDEAASLDAGEIGSECEEHLGRVRRICLSMPEATEKLSHGEPAFFAKKDKGVFAMFAGNHHKDGRVALWLPAASGMQGALIKSAPKTYFRPPYVGPSGWVGIELREIGDDDLAGHIAEAWELIVAKTGKSAKAAVQALEKTRQVRRKKRKANRKGRANRK